jgi:hypothetical protein
MSEIEKQAFIAAVKKTTAPKIKWCKYSQFGDKGFIGVQDDTKSVKTSKILSYKYLPSKNFTDYTTARHRVVSYPKPIKLGSTGSSSKRCGAVKKFKYTKNSKSPKNSQKIKIFKKFKLITKMTARALVITFKCNNFFPIKIGQEKMEIFTKLFDINLEISKWQCLKLPSERR